MSDLNKKLSEIYDELSALYIEFNELGVHKQMTMEKKLSYYNRSNLLINEAKNILGELESRIDNIDMTNATPSQNTSVNKLVEILNMNPTFDQTLGIVAELENVFSKITTVEVVDNIETDILYDIDLEEKN